MADEEKKEVEGLKQGMTIEDLQSLIKSQGLRIVSESDYTTKAEAGNDLKKWKSVVGDAKTPEDLQARLSRLEELEKAQTDRENKNKSALQKAEETLASLTAERDSLAQKADTVMRENLVRNAISQYGLRLDLRFVDLDEVKSIDLENINEETEKEKLKGIIDKAYKEQEQVVNMHLGKLGEEPEGKTTPHPILGLIQKGSKKEKKEKDEEKPKPPGMSFGFGSKTV